MRIGSIRRSRRNSGILKMGDKNVLWAVKLLIDFEWNDVRRCPSPCKVIYNIYILTIRTSFFVLIECFTILAAVHIGHIHTLPIQSHSKSVGVFFYPCLSTVITAHMHKQLDHFPVANESRILYICIHRFRSCIQALAVL